MPFREKISARPSVMSGQILKVASAFDELCEGRPERAGGALEALHSCPGYLYDTRVLAALEVVLDRRGLLEDTDSRVSRWTASLRSRPPVAGVGAVPGSPRSTRRRCRCR